MPVVNVPNNSTLKLQLRTGTDPSGDPIYKTKSLNNTKPTAVDQDLYDVAISLGGLQGYLLTAITIIDSAGLLNE